MNPARSSTRLRVLRVERGTARERRDAVACEEPLEIRLSYRRAGQRVVRPVSVTMRTPGDDVELSVGFLLAEAIVRERESVAQVAHCGGAGADPNVVEVRLSPDALVDESLLDRNFYVSSSCGMCGKASIEGVAARGDPFPRDDLTLSAEMISSLPARLRSSQVLFDRTGGLHAAGVFDRYGTLLVSREDVGRHNAVDKVVGHCFLHGMVPLLGRVLVVSGRSSFEILQKAAAAGISCVVAVGAPSSLAVDLARRFEMTLVGFARDDGFNVYAGAHRLS